MNPKIKELQRKIDNAISQKKRMMSLSLLEELRVEQDKEEKLILQKIKQEKKICLLYTSPSPRDATLSRMPSSA